MRLQEVLEITKLSKKAIYFYIKEELIHPSKSLENGYYDFSEDDLNKLNIIISLRKIGMPIQEIKDIFMYPTLTNFFIHRQINILKDSIYEQVNQLKTAYYLIENIPANATPNNIKIPFQELNKDKIKNESFLETHFPSVDSRMIAILICAPFTDIESSQYHKFLWDKISNELKIQLESNLSNLKKMIYNLTPEQIYQTSIYQFGVCRKISEADDDELQIYEEMLYERCIELIENVELQRYWKLVYEPILLPTLAFLNGKVNELLDEYNPRYTNYNKNMDKIALGVFERLRNEPETLSSLTSCLDGKFNPERFNHAELICINTFKKSIFTQVKIETLMIDCYL